MHNKVVQRGRFVFGSCLVETDDSNRKSPQLAVALDQRLADLVGRGERPPTVRLWTNDRAVVCPSWQTVGNRSMSVRDDYGRRWPMCTRTSGGSVVAHGPGALNMSIMLRAIGLYDPSIETAYELWVDILRCALARDFATSVTHGSVAEAFCNGRYDIIGDNRKLAGVAQSRRNGSVLIHGTILVDVDRRRYMQVIAAAESQLGIPSKRHPGAADEIVSLCELAGRTVTCNELAFSLGRVASGHHGLGDNESDDGSREAGLPFEAVMEVSR